MKISWRWLRFGGWFEKIKVVVPEDRRGLHPSYLLVLCVAVALGYPWIRLAFRVNDLLVILKMMGIFSMGLLAICMATYRIPQKWLFRVLSICAIGIAFAGFLEWRQSLLPRGDLAAILIKTSVFCVFVVNVGFSFLVWRVGVPRIIPCLALTEIEIHARGGRILADVFKVGMILLAIYFASMPFWPLAVPPVPPDMMAKYPAPKEKPRGNGVAENMWKAMYPEPFTEEEAPPLERLHQMFGELFGRPNPFPPRAIQLLDEVATPIHEWAETCAQEDPPKQEATRKNRRWLGHSLSPWMEALKYTAAWNVQERNAVGALRALKSTALIHSYFTRANVMWDWWGGMMGPRNMMPGIVALYSTDMLDPNTAREVAGYLDAWQAGMGSADRAMVKEVEALEQWMILTDLEMHREGKRSPENMTKLEIAKILLSGYSVSVFTKVAGNEMDRRRIEAAIWGDPAQRDPAAAVAEMALWKHCDSSVLKFFKRGWPLLDFRPDFTVYYRQLFEANAHLLIGKALLAIGAYRQAQGELPATLEDALAWMGPDYGLEAPYVRSRPEYKRLDAGAPSETNRYAFTLTVWGDGGRCSKQGGVSWLIVRNPAFGCRGVQAWNWTSMLGGRAEDVARKNGLVSDAPGVQSPEVRMIGEADSFDTALVHEPTDRIYPALLVPAAVLGSKPDQFNMVFQFGWQHQYVWEQQALDEAVSSSSPASQELSSED